jgi:hypothetical protein
MITPPAQQQRLIIYPRLRRGDQSEVINICACDFVSVLFAAAVMWCVVNKSRVCGGGEWVDVTVPFQWQAACGATRYSCNDRNKGYIVRQCSIDH